MQNKFCQNWVKGDSTLAAVITKLTRLLCGCGTSSAHIQQWSYSTRCRKVVGKTSHPASSQCPVCIPNNIHRSDLLGACCHDNLFFFFSTNMRKTQNDEMRGKRFMFLRRNVNVPAISPFPPIFGVKLNEWFNTKIPFLFLSVQSALSKMT